MGFQKVERLPLERFTGQTASWTPVRGTYLFPLRLLDVTQHPNDPNDYLEVIRVIDVNGNDVAVTRGGGLYVRCADNFQDSDEDMQRYVDTFNLIACEVSLEGHFAGPITDHDIGPAKLIGEYVGTWGGGGWFAETHWQPFMILATEPRRLEPAGVMWAPNGSWFLADSPGLLDRVAQLRNVNLLRAVSVNLPALVCAAIYHAARHNVAESITTGWISCEVILSFWWDEYLSTIQDGRQRDRLSDQRTYTAAVRTEFLLTAGRMRRELYDYLNPARQIRNTLAHRGRASLADAERVIAALRATLEALGVNADRVGWGYGRGGLVPPSPAPEPSFQFRRYHH